MCYNIIHDKPKVCESNSFPVKSSVPKIPAGQLMFCKILLNKFFSFMILLCFFNFCSTSTGKHSYRHPTYSYKPLLRSTTHHVSHIVQYALPS